MNLREIVKGKKVLFITTHRIDYIRNTQEINLLTQYTEKTDCLFTSADNHFFSMVYILLKLLFMPIKDYDVIVVSYMSQLIVPFMSPKFKNKTLIVDFFISLYDSLVFDRQKFPESSFAAKMLYKLDEKTIAPADWVIADTKAHADYFKEAFGADPAKTEVLYLEADTDIYHPMIIEKEEPYKGKFLVIYFGTVIPLQGIDVILETIRLLQDNKKIHFLIIGPIETKYQRVDSDTVTYIRWLPQEELARKIAMADLCLAGHFNDTIMKAKRTIPGKAYIYEAMEKPMILGDSPANHELFTEDGKRHFYVPMGNPAALAEKIKYLYKNSER